MNVNYSIIMLLFLVAGFILLVTLRKLYFATLSTTKDAKMKASNKTTKIAEGIVLLCAGILILVFTATNKSTGGQLLRLEQYNHSFVTIHIIIGIIAAAGLLVGVVFTFFYKTSVGLTIAVVFMSFYGILLNNHNEFIESIASGKSSISDLPLVLRLSKSPIEGAELWVNGVLLGQTPVQTTIKEFVDKVPYWSEPPEGYRNKTDDLQNPYYSPSGSSGYDIYEGWEQFELLHISDKYSDIESKTRGKKYYARVKFDGQWGYFAGGGGASGNSDGIEHHFSVMFPNVNERLDTMLDIARLNDYQVDEEWFEAMGKYGQVGLNAIYNAINDEPGMNKVLDNWANWEYGLDKVTDEKSAWEVFEEICHEADQIESYSTMSIAGRAVEMLISKMNQEQIVNKAKEVIRSNHTYGWIYWASNGQAQFGMTYRPEGFLTPPGYILGGQHNSQNNEPLVSNYTVAHAIWALDKLLDSQDDRKPNIVELEVVPNLLCWGYTFDMSLRLAAYLGGPDIERFLYRHNWRANAQDLPFDQRFHLPGADVNKWLLLLSNLDSSFGRKFRNNNKRLLLQYANTIDVMSLESSGLFGQNPFGFLFIDKNLALEYWPEFRIRSLSKANGDMALELQSIYLTNMEPLSTVEMYVDTWKKYSNSESDFHRALRVLDKLPQEKHDLIIEGIEQLLNDDQSQVQDMLKSQRSIFLIKEIRSRNWSKKREAENIIDGLTKNTGEYFPQAVPGWLEHKESDHPLIGMLADSNEPGLRLLVMGALRENPTPSNRAILDKLLNDTNDEVRNAAKQVAIELEQMKNTQVCELISE